MTCMRRGDLVIRAASSADAAEFCVCDASTGRVVDFYATLAEAIVAAHRTAITQRVSVWHEQVDDRGQALGAPTLLYSCRA